MRAQPLPISRDLHGDVLALHAALGFSEVGRASIHGGAKTVRYLGRSLGPEPK